jgi:hypothetical protein
MIQPSKIGKTRAGSKKKQLPPNALDAFLAFMRNPTKPTGFKSPNPLPPSVGRGVTSHTSGSPIDNLIRFLGIWSK